jgi:predicted Fe-S protein YdhL (DUF1289 family)
MSESRDDPGATAPARDDAARDGWAEARARRRAERQRLIASGPRSPCISVCQLDDRTGWCIGCHRTIDEIRDWIIMEPAERLAVLDRLAERRRLSTSQP